MLTVVTTLKSQRRNVLDFITSAVSAARVGKASPSLLPKVPLASKQVTNAA
jgi:ribosome recycling factor